MGCTHHLRPKVEFSILPLFLQKCSERMYMSYHSSLTHSFIHSFILKRVSFCRTNDLLHSRNRWHENKKEDML